MDISNLENVNLLDNIYIDRDTCSLDDIFSSIDQDGDGFISYSEFEDFINATTTSTNNTT